MKKLFFSVLALFTIFSITSFALDMSSHSIVAKNDKEATLANGYPVINVKNTTNNDLLVTYNFHISDANDAKVEQVAEDILIKANSNIVLELKELSFLGKDGSIRRVWFSWPESDKLKPQNTFIDTFSFTITPPVELGLK